MFMRKAVLPQYFIKYCDECYLLFFWLFCEFIFEMNGDKLLKFSAEDAD